MRTRRGISMVELLAVLSGCSVILTTSGMLIHRAMHAQSQTRHYFDVERAAWRLSDQFRRDVHQALSATSGEAEADENVLLQLDLGDGESISYQRSKERVTRILSRNSRVAVTEDYLLTFDMEVKVSEESSPTGYVLTVEGNVRESSPGVRRRPASIREAPLSLRVEAVLNRDRRFAEAHSPEESS